MREFESFHPIVILLYFASVVFFTMFLNHPVFLIISLLIAMIFSIKLVGIDDFKKKARFAIIFFIIISITNPLFIHKGATILFHFNGNAITLEAIIYGAAFACMIISVVFWFNSFNKLMSSDKIIYIFSSTIPTIGLIISMVLRFIPRFQKQLKKIMDINKVSSDPSKVNKIRFRLKAAFTACAILLTWAFENSIDTANSMKARGYGLKNRTNFNLYKFEFRDIMVVILIILFTILNIVFYYYLDLRFYFYPEIAQIKIDLLSCLAYLNYALLLCLPLIIEYKEERKWKSLISKI